jgi:hypothetical protein
MAVLETESGSMSPTGRTATHMPFYARAFAPDNDLTGGLGKMREPAKRSKSERGVNYTYGNPPLDAKYNATVAKFLSFYPQLAHPGPGGNMSELGSLGSVIGVPYCAFNGPNACDKALNSTLTKLETAGARENNGTLVMEVMDELRMAQHWVGWGSNETKSREFNKCMNQSCVDGLFRTWAEARNLSVADVGCTDWAACPRPRSWGPRNCSWGLRNI